MNKLKVLDLFSGIGMFSYGLERTGLYETVSFCEWDKSCQEVLKKHWPSVDIHEDIRFLEYSCGGILSTDTKGNLRQTNTVPDVIVGGFPCQDVSSANYHGQGLRGSRSGLWAEYLRVIREVKPKGVIIENVTNLWSRGFETVLKDLDSVGYDAEWHCIQASHFGASHERDRIWILAYPSGKQWKDAVSLEQAGAERFQKRACGEDLQKVCNNPFGRSGGIPQPLFRGMDAEDTLWVDRLKQVGNTVYWPIVEQLGYHLHDNLRYRE